MKQVIRPLPLVAAFVVLGVAIVLALSGHAAWWVIPTGVLGPDLSFLAALGAPPTGHGLMPVQAVRPYNIVHHPAGPLLAAAVALVVGNATGLALSLAWGSHLLWDRGVGYGLRAQDGSIIRPGSSARRSPSPLAQLRRMQVAPDGVSES